MAGVDLFIASISVLGIVGGVAAIVIAAVELVRWMR